MGVSTFLGLLASGFTLLAVNRMFRRFPPSKIRRQHETGVCFRGWLSAGGWLTRDWASARRASARRWLRDAAEGAPPKANTFMHIQRFYGKCSTTTFNLRNKVYMTSGLTVIGTGTTVGSNILAHIIISSPLQWQFTLMRDLLLYCNYACATKFNEQTF